jgi:hypothetical protein
MAVNKPTGDNRRRYRLHEARQDVRRVHGCEEAEGGEESGQKI